jgi:hypothetical protein
MINRAVVAGLAVGLSGCLNYEFQPVGPTVVVQNRQSYVVVSTRPKANVMLLVDKSGSMAEAIGTGGTRMQQLQGAMDDLLTTQGASARLGLASFPVDPTCGASTALDEPLPPPSVGDDAAQDQAKADAIRARIHQFVPSGGTPTAASLAFVGATPGLNDPNDGRDDFIVLLTDGLPNCNADNPNGQCTQANPACACTLASATSCLSPSTYCASGCLDRDGTVATIADLRSRRIRTVVVGFGADTAAGAAPATLSAMATAGGYARPCPLATDAECGTGNTCNATTLLCNTPFYQAQNRAELSAALAEIWKTIGNPISCHYLLETQPQQAQLLAVLVDGQDVPKGPDSWEFKAGAVDLVGALCARAMASTPARPLNLEIRVVETL